MSTSKPPQPRSDRATAVRALRRRTGAPLRVALAALRSHPADMQAAAAAIRFEGIRRIRHPDICTPQQATAAYEVHGWDLDAARASIFAAQEAQDLRCATDALARTLLDDGTLADLVILGQRDDQSTVPEETSYYVAGFFERIRGTVTFLSFDCDDLNRGLVTAAQRLGLTEFHALLVATLLLTEDDRIGYFCNRMDTTEDQAVLDRVRDYARGNMSSFRVLSS